MFFQTFFKIIGKHLNSVHLHLSSKYGAFFCKHRYLMKHFLNFVFQNVSRLFQGNFQNISRIFKEFFFNIFHVWPRIPCLTRSPFISTHQRVHVLHMCPVPAPITWSEYYQSHNIFNIINTIIFSILSILWYFQYHQYCQSYNIFNIINIIDIIIFSSKSPRPSPVPAPITKNMVRIWSIS